MAKSIEILDKIAGRTPDTPLVVGSRADYDQNYELDDLDDNSLVPKRVLVGYIPPSSALPPREITLGGKADDVIDLPIPTGYYGEKAYVVNADGYADWTRIYRDVDGVYKIRLLDASTNVMFI